MLHFLIDEDLPRSLARLLRAAGMVAEDARDTGLRNRPDEEVFKYAVSQGHVLLSGDLGFANLLRFPLATHAGIIVARFPNEVLTSTLNAAILNVLQTLAEDDVTGNLIIIEPGRIRLRKRT